MPDVNTLKTAILERQRLDMPITQIAQELGVSRNTVYKHLTLVDDWEAYVKDKSRNINRLALITVEKSVQRGNAQVAMQWLSRTLLAPDAAQVYHITGDMTLQQHLTLLPSTPGTPGTPSSAMSTSTASEPTADRSSREGPGSDMSLSVRTNFLQNLSTADLEAELARRRAATAIDAEVIG